MKVGIVGLGLIGGSLAWEFTRLGHQVWGTSRKPDTCQTAIARGIVHQASTELASLAPVDIVFICTPIPFVLSTLQQLTAILNPKTIVTDVASVKAPIVRAATDMWPNFVGGHPMAGTAQQGIDAAQLELFRGCTYAITPLKSTPIAAAKTLRELLAPLAINCVETSPEIHDAAVAWISHLPVVVSSSLVEACSSAPDSELILARQLASSGFRDTSRVGGGNPELGTAMAQFNREALLKTLQAYRDCLNRRIAAIEDEDWQQVKTSLSQTQRARPPFVDRP